MIEIKALWFYIALAAALSGGIGAGAALYPAFNDVPAMVRQAKQEALRECAMTEQDREWKRSTPQNTQGREF